MFWQTVNDMFSNTAQTEQDVHNSISHSAFNLLNILIGIRYIKEWWPHIIRIIYTFWNFTCQNAYSLSKAWLHRPPQHPPFTTTSLNHPQILCCCQEPASLFFCDFFQKPISYHFLNSHQPPDINACCRQYCFMEDKKNYQVNPPQLNIVYYQAYVTAVQ